MEKLINKLSLCTLMSFIVSCVSADDRTLSPPLNIGWVNIEIENPFSYTKPFTLEVLYVSTTCKRELMSM